MMKAVATVGDSGTVNGSAGRGGYVTTRDTWGYGFDKTTNKSNSNTGSSTEGRSSWIRGQSPGMSRYPAMAAGAIPAPRSNTGGGTEQHQSYNRNSWRPSAIGLAISPSKHTGKTTPTPTPTRLRPLSKLLPAKPDMPPAPPPKNASPSGGANAVSMNRQANSSPSYGQQQQQQKQEPKYEFLHPIAAQFLRPAVPPATVTTAIDKPNADNTQQPASLRLCLYAGFGLGLPYIYNPDAGNLRAMVGYIFAAFCFLSLVGTWFWIPEMKGRTPSEIDRMFELKLKSKDFVHWHPTTVSYQAKNDA
ncbi:hypothetical protein NQ176_g2012 [Zarea fungicola]|uniref:Uncharacterized protein n=1 Tax=Zarea fungicola TaxID=93591 RepID=A0ACC1NRG4_9HYPO|nr:hypothetical protein NQ176_g2012 [Lecanicillium fungicola]